MKLKCVVVDCHTSLTLDKIYEAKTYEGCGELYYWLKNDEGKSCGYFRSRFEVVEEEIDMGNMWNRGKIKNITEEAVVVAPEGTAYQVILKSGKELSIVTKMDLHQACQEEALICLKEKDGGVEKVVITLSVKEIAAIITEK